MRSLAAPRAPDPSSEQSASVVLCSRDPSCEKWGKRWLGQSDFDVQMPPGTATVDAIRRLAPDVVILDAGLLEDGIPVYMRLVEAADVDAAVIVLCQTARQIAEALDARVFDVARKPYEWRGIANRARKAFELVRSRRLLSQREGELDQSREIVAAAQRRIQNNRTIDSVTGLPNRARFIELLRRGMQASDRDGTALGVLVIGFTRFRLVIEAMGQEQANQVLAEIGRSLNESLQSVSNELVTPSAGLSTAAVASIDQARFGVMLTCPADAQTLGRVQQAFLETLSRPVLIRGQAVHLSACLGITSYPQDADTADSLLQRADNAMRSAQSRGGGFRFYDAKSDRAAARKLDIENRLYEAMETNALSLNYQPISNVADGRVVALEALLRWRTEDGENVSPEEFVPIAEESGLIIRLGQWVLDAAVAQLATWQRQGLEMPRVCVNVSQAQMLNPDLPNVVQRVLSRHEVSPEQLELEICERGVLNGDKDVIQRLTALRELGVRLSIDDFGTGDSAIGYLKDLPIDVLKIDRSYISAMGSDDRASAMAAAMIVLGQKLGLQVVAEGVETRQQLAELRSIGCDAYQGFLQSKPLPANEFADWFNKTLHRQSKRAAVRSI